MASEIVRHLTPEEEELLRKREELAAVRANLAERELELTDFRSQLASFSRGAICGRSASCMPNWMIGKHESLSYRQNSMAQNPRVSRQLKHGSRRAPHMKQRTVRHRGCPTFNRQRT